MGVCVGGGGGEGVLQIGFDFFDLLLVTYKIDPLTSQ